MADAEIDKLGKYEIRGTLGKGAMGVVYDGWDPLIERRVAIKTVLKDLTAGAEGQQALQRFKREAQAAGRISHPNIVAIYEYGEDQGMSFIAMEFVKGRELKDFFDEGDRFPPERTVDIMSQLLDALDYAHRQGVVHRDIKPANIMIMEHGQVKVTDFGVARIESSTMTQAGAVLGTPSYMSPEQFMGQTVDKRSDLFSAGAVLYQLLTGEKPFQGALTTIMHKVLNEEPTRPSALNVQIPDLFDEIVSKSMAKRPADRFQDATEFKAALADALAGKPLAKPQTDEGEATAFNLAVAGGGDDGDATMIAGVGSGAAPARPAPKAADATVMMGDDDATKMASPASSKPGAPKPKGKPPVVPIAAGIVGLLVAGGIGYAVLGVGGDTQPDAGGQDLAQTGPATAGSGAGGAEAGDGGSGTTAAATGAGSAGTETPAGTGGTQGTGTPATVGGSQGGDDPGTNGTTGAPATPPAGSEPPATEPQTVGSAAGASSGSDADPQTTTAGAGTETPSPQPADPAPIQQAVTSPDQQNDPTPPVPTEQGTTGQGTGGQGTGGAADPARTEDPDPAPGTQTAALPPDEPAEPPPPPPPTVGMVMVKTDPQGATVEVDGETIGVTPSLALSIPVGTRVLTLRKNGFQPQDVAVTVTEDAPVPVSIRLLPD